MYMENFLNTFIIINLKELNHKYIREILHFYCSLLSRQQVRLLFLLRSYAVWFIVYWSSVNCVMVQVQVMFLKIVADIFGLYLFKKQRHSLKKLNKSMGDCDSVKDNFF